MIGGNGFGNNNNGIRYPANAATGNYQQGYQTPMQQQQFQRVAPNNGNYSPIANMQRRIDMSNPSYPQQQQQQQQQPQQQYIPRNQQVGGSSSSNGGRLPPPGDVFDTTKGKAFDFNSLGPLEFGEHQRHTVIEGIYGASTERGAVVSDVISQIFTPLQDEYNSAFSSNDQDTYHYMGGGSSSSGGFSELFASGSRMGY